MAARVTPRDIGALIEVRKKIAELSYKKGFAQRVGADEREIRIMEDELKRLEERKASLEKKAGNVEIFVPFQAKLEELQKRIEANPQDEVDMALRGRSGELYEMLRERGKILKRNVEARNEIGKLVLLARPLYPGLCGKIAEAVKEGRVPDVEAQSLGGKAEKVVSALNRVGIACRVSEGKLVSSEEPWGEAKVFMNNGHIWIPKESLDRFNQNEVELEQVGIRLQVKNAERQVRQFGEAETKEFEDLQNRYIGLLRVRKEISDSYEKEMELEPPGDIGAVP